MSKKSIATCSVQNFTASVDDYVVQFNAFRRKTAESIIGMAEVVYKAKKELDAPADKGRYFKKFCEAIRYEHDSSSIRKLCKIGEMADTLKRHAEQLPNTWTTIYTLSQLGSEVLERMIEDQRVVATITAQEAHKLLEDHTGKAKPPRKAGSGGDGTAANDPTTDASYSLVVRFPSTPTAAEAETIEKAILAVLAKKSFLGQVTRSNALDLMLKNPPASIPMAA